MKGGLGQLRYVQSRCEVLVGVGAVSSTEGNACSVSPTQRSRLIKALLFPSGVCSACCCMQQLVGIVCHEGPPNHSLPPSPLRGLSEMSTHSMHCRSVGDIDAFHASQVGWGCRRIPCIAGFYSALVRDIDAFHTMWVNMKVYPHSSISIWCYNGSGIVRSE